MGYAAGEVEDINAVKRSEAAIRKSYDALGGLIKKEEMVQRQRLHTAVQLIASVPAVIVMVTDVALRNTQPVVTSEQTRVAALC